MINHISKEELKKLFSKPYGVDAPTKKEWEKFYNQDVLFIDPTQEKKGIDAYVDAQKKLMQRCDDVFLTTKNIAVSEDVGFVEWTMGLKIMGKEFIYPGTSKLKFDGNGKIIEHRDYFDFCGPTFGPVPILGSFIRWLYGRFTS